MFFAHVLTWSNYRDTRRIGRDLAGRGATLRPAERDALRGSEAGRARG